MYLRIIPKIILKSSAIKKAKLLPLGLYALLSTQTSKT
jgi:hypothetical protein